MASVTGTIWDAGLGHLLGKTPVLFFILNSPNAKSGGLYSTEPVKVTPAADGTFTVDLASTTDMQDDGWYTLRVQWVNSTDPETFGSVDYPDWAMEVPTTGGRFSDLFGKPPRNRRMVFVSLTAPEKPQRWSLWLQQDPTDPNSFANTGNLYEWRGSSMSGAWEYLANVKGQKGDVGNLTRGTIPANTNLNTLISAANHSGVWGTSSANLATYVNMPVGPAGTVEAGALFVIVSGNGSVTQQFAPFARNALYQRATVNSGGTSWTSWVDIVVGTAPYNRGIIPTGTDLNTMISPSLHSGQWGTSGANLASYANLPVQETGILEVIAPGTGAAVQRFTPYAKGITYSRSATNTSGASWTAWLAAADSSATSAVALPDPTAPLESNEGVVEMFGDSLTMAGGVASRLAALMPSKTIHNYGVSGQTAGQIAARQGGGPSLITVTGNTIPASGPVAVTARTQQFLAQTGLPAKSMTGRLAGVAGTMSVLAGQTSYTFTRTTAGDAVNCPPNTPFVPDQGKGARANLQIIWAGENNPETGIVEYVMAMCRHLSPAHKKFLVLSVTGTSADGAGTARYKLYTGANEQLAYELGARFYDLRRWLIDNGLAAVGITPTAEDSAAIAADTIPPSLTTDGTHFTPAAQTVIGEQVHAQLVALGWD